MSVRAGGSRARRERSPDRSRPLSAAERLRHPDGQQLPHQRLRKGLVDRSWLFLSAQVTLYGAEVNVVRARRLWPRSILQPPLTEADQRALTDLAKQQERRPEQAINVEFTPQANDPDPDGHAR